MFNPILAYLDAGSGSMLLQVLLGGFAGVAAFVKYRWDQIRRKKPQPSTVEGDSDS